MVVYRVGGLLKRRGRRKEEHKKEEEGDSASGGEADEISCRRDSSLQEENGKKNRTEEVISGSKDALETEGALREEGEMLTRSEGEFPEILVTGLHHAREPLSMLMCLYLIGKKARERVKAE